MKLSNFDKVRENNFTLLRFIFAWAVLVGHSFPITGNGSDPLSMLLLPNTWIGHVAVSGFFAISGFLVSASIMRRRLVEFVASRVLRLYPAIIVYSLVAILVIGPLSVQVPLNNYFSANPWYNLLNAHLWEWQYNLPYAFVNNPLPGATNGATWTLPVEVRCYLLILAMGFIGAFDARIRANAALLFLLFLVHVNYPSIPVFGQSANFASPLEYFLIGSLFWVNRELIPLNWIFGFAAVVGVMASIKTSFHGYVFPIAFTYLIFMAVYKVPHIDMDRIGDISYGVYIYAWPIQQMVWHPGQSAYTNLAFSSAIVFVVAYFSWRFIEKPALKLRTHLPALRRLGGLFVRPVPQRVVEEKMPQHEPWQPVAVRPDDYFLEKKT